MFRVEYITIPMVVGAVLVAACLIIAMVYRFKYALFIIGGMFFVSSIGLRAIKLEGGGLAEIRKLWMFPLQVNRSAVYLALGALLFVTVVSHSRRTVMHIAPTQAVLLMTIALYAGFLRMFHESPVVGLQSISFALVTFVPLILVVPALVQEEGGIRSLFYMLLATNLVWVGGVAVQMAINPAMLADGVLVRFFGLTGNAQHTAAYLAVIAVIQLWILLYTPPARFKAAWYAWTAVNIVLLIWTGSRTGAGMFAIGVAVAIHGRLGRTVLLFPVVAVALIGALWLASLLNVDVADAAAHITSLEDTRTKVWAKQMGFAFENPLFGVGPFGTGSENSYLYGISAYGIGMGLLLLILIGVSVRIMWRLYLMRPLLNDERRGMVDLLIAFNGMYFASAMLDGHIMARVGAPTMLMIVFSSIASVMLKQLAAESHETQEREDHSDYEHGADSDELAYGYAVGEGYGPDET